MINNGDDKRVPQLKGVELVGGGWVNKYLLTYELPDGSSYVYEAASRKGLEDYRAALRANAEGRASAPDALCLVPRLPDGSYLLIREFRYPLNSWCIAFPAGLVDPGETLAECAARELREETGCRVRTELGEQAVRLMPQAGYSSTGLTDENVQVAFVEAEPDGAAHPEPNELIEPFTLRPEEIEPFLTENRTPIGTRAQLILLALAEQHRSAANSDC